MVIVDTSIWIDHFRNSNESLKALLRNDQVLMHPFVIGELACGNLKDRQSTVSLLGALLRCTVASDMETLHMIEIQKLYGEGIGFVDAHLLAACQLARCTIWTKDRALLAVAGRLGIVHLPN